MSQPSIKVNILRKVSALSSVREDISAFVSNIRWSDVIDDAIPQASFILEQPWPDPPVNQHFHLRYREGDCVEIWVDDGISGCNLTNNLHRAFVGRIDRIVPTVESGGFQVEITARDYSADIMEALCYFWYYDSSVLNLFTAIVDDYNSRSGSVQPKFKITIGSFTDFRINFTPNEVSYWDALSKLCQMIGFTMWIDGRGFDPTLPDSASNRVQIHIEAKPVSTDLTWSVEYGVNMIKGVPAVAQVKAKDDLTIWGKDDFDTRFRVVRERWGYDNNHIGINEHNRKSGFLKDEDLLGWDANNDLADFLIDNVSEVRKEFTFEISPARYEVGKRAAGNIILVSWPDVPNMPLEILQATYTWSRTGLSCTLNLAKYNAAWGRLFCPPTKGVTPVGISDLYDSFYMYWAVSIQDPNFEFSIKKVNPFTPGTTEEVFKIPKTNFFKVSPIMNYGVYGGWALAPQYAADRYYFGYHYNIVENKGYVTVYRSADNVIVATGNALRPLTGTFYTITVSGGVNGTVTMVRLAVDALSATDWIMFGLPTNKYGFGAISGGLFMRYHRNHLYIIGSPYDGTARMWKYTLTGTLVSTWVMPSITDSTGTVARLMGFAMIPDSTESFWITIQGKTIKTGTYNGTLSDPLFVKGINEDGNLVYPKMNTGILCSCDKGFYIYDFMYLVNDPPPDTAEPYPSLITVQSEVMDPDFTDTFPIAERTKLSANSLQRWFDNTVNFFCNSQIAWDYNGGLWRIWTKNSANPYPYPDGSYEYALVKYKPENQQWRSYGLLGVIDLSINQPVGLTIVPFRPERRV